MLKRRLVLILLALWLAACNEGNEAQSGATLAEAQATAASEVDRGESPVVVFQRATTEEVALEEWRIYDGGRAAIIRLAPAGDAGIQAQTSQVELDAGSVATLLQELETAGFYEAAERGEQSWNDNLNYLIHAQRAGEWYALAIERVTPQTSAVRLQSLAVMERFIFEQIEE